MILYKLTDENGQTYGKTQWGEGITHSGTGEGELCGPGFIHAYESALLAVLLNPIHANFQNPKLWEAEGEIVKNDNGLKCGCVSLTTLKEIPLPAITTEMRVKFAVLCATQIYKDPIFLKWAAEAAWAAAEAAVQAAWAVWAAHLADIPQLNLIQLAEEACTDVI